MHSIIFFNYIAVWYALQNWKIVAISLLPKRNRYMLHMTCSKNQSYLIKVHHCKVPFFANCLFPWGNSKKLNCTSESRWSLSCLVEPIGKRRFFSIFRISSILHFQTFPWTYFIIACPSGPTIHIVSEKFWLCPK